MADAKTQQMILDKAYEAVADKVVERVKKKKDNKKISEETSKSIEIPKVPDPDIYDKMWVWTRSNVPDVFLPFILVAGLYAVFQVPINGFLKRTIGITIEDLKYVVKRRKERDKEIKKEKK